MSDKSGHVTRDKRPVVWTEPKFVAEMVLYATATKTTVETKGRGNNREVWFTSFDGAVSFEEKMPGFHAAGWALWCAFRLLHPARLYDFEVELRALFAAYKAGGRNWITYNEEKRALLQRYLEMPYQPTRKELRK